MTSPGDDQRHDVRTYTIGYLAALALTLAAFAAVYWQPFDTTVTLGIVLGLALVQTIVQFRFFLHISLQTSARDDLQLILFSTLIILLMVSGTLVVLLNLRHRMM